MNKPFYHNGKQMFPMMEQKYGWLKVGQQFKTKHGMIVWTVGVDRMAVNGEQVKYFPEEMPVIPVKNF